MAAVLLPARRGLVVIRRADGRRELLAFRSDSGVDRLIRLASDGALVSGVAFAVAALGLYAVVPSSEYLPVAVAATALALPLHLRHLRCMLAGTRPRYAGWTLAAMAAVLLAPAPLVGASWLHMFHVLAGSALLLLRPRWAIPAYAGVVMAAALGTIVLGFGEGSEGWPIAGLAAWLGLSVASRGLVPVVLVWLVIALRQLQAARLALANEAVELERERMDHEFRDAVGLELEVLVAEGERAGELAGASVALVETEVRCLVDRSRRTLADARRMLHRYRLPLQTELESAVALLQVAGVDAVLELPDGDLPAALDETQRSSLRQLTTELLHADLPGRVIVGLVRDGGQLRPVYWCDAPPSMSWEPVA